MPQICKQVIKHQLNLVILNKRARYKKTSWLTNKLNKIFGNYLCSIAMASLVFNWSSPKVKAKRRASSFMPLNVEDDLSKL